MRTFDGKLELKSGLLASLERAPQDALLNKFGSTSDEINTSADEYHLPRAVVLLARAISLTIFASEEERFRNLHDSIEAIPVGADCTMVANRWLHWSASDSQLGAAVELQDVEARDLADQIKSLHERSVSETIPPAEWRRIRNAMGKIKERLPKSIERDAIVALANGCWDLSKMPGVVVDAFSGWWELQPLRAYASIDFSTEDLREFADKNFKAYERALIEVEPEPAATRNQRAIRLGEALLTQTDPMVSQRGTQAMSTRDAFWNAAREKATREFRELLQAAPG